MPRRVARPCGTAGPQGQGTTRQVDNESRCAASAAREGAGGRQHTDHRWAKAGVYLASKAQRPEGARPPHFPVSTRIAVGPVQSFSGNRIWPASLCLNPEA